MEQRKNQNKKEIWTRYRKDVERKIFGGGVGGNGEKKNTLPEFDVKIKFCINEKESVSSTQTLIRTSKGLII